MEQSFTDARKPAKRTRSPLWNRGFGTFLEMVTRRRQRRRGGRGLRHRRRLRHPVRLRRGDLHRGRGLRHERNRHRHRAGADCTLRRRPNRRAADPPSRPDRRRFKGAEAYRLGIAHYLVKDTAASTPSSRNPEADRPLRPPRQCADQGVVMKVGSEPFSSVLDFAADHSPRRGAARSAAEGLRAFAEKSPPRWATE